jgi:two-component system, chemotaxis family, chemotaxis protein CheV
MTTLAEESALSGSHSKGASNTMDVLLFSLGTREVFGINVFKVREVTRAPKITPTPNFKAGVRGVISIRGHIIPVLDLAAFTGFEGESHNSCSTLMVTQFHHGTQGFLVHSVDHIVHIEWSKIKPPSHLTLGGRDSLVTGITEMEDGTLVSILDVEQILVAAFGEKEMPSIAPLATSSKASVLLVDDSSVARKKIIQVLEKISVNYQQASNGREAWERLDALAQRCASEGGPLRDYLSLILTDVEMPEMDGYALTRQIKADARFKDIPVVMHSSLSTQTNRAMASSAGADGYVEKFEPLVLADTLRPYLSA